MHGKCRAFFPLIVNTHTASHIKNILSRLNQIGSAINSGSSGGLASLQDILRLIVSSATEVVQDSSAVIYTYDTKRAAFNLESRVSSEPYSDSQESDAPRPNGIGSFAMATKQRVLSYEHQNLQIHPAKVAMGAKAMACYPLMVADETLGTLYVYLHKRKSFNELELLMLDNFVNLTAMTLAAAQRVSEVQLEQVRKEKELRRIHRAGMLISSHTSLQDTLDSILRMALDVTEAKYGIFRLVDKDRTHLVTHAFIGERQGKPATEKLPLDEKSVMGTVAMRRLPLIISDLSEPPWNQVYYPFDRELVMRSELAVPLIGASGKLEGVLNLESPLINSFSKQDRYILQILATLAVAAIQEVRLIDALQELTTYLLSQPLYMVHQSLVEKASDLLNVPHSLLWLREDDQLVIQAATDPDMLNWSISLHETLIGQAMESGKPMISYDLKEDIPSTLSNPAELGPALIVPLFAPEEPGMTKESIGAFSIHCAADDPRNFEQSEWDKNVLSILGRYATLAMQNAAHQEAIRIAQEQHTVTEAFAAVGDIASNLLHKLNNKIGTIPVRIEGIQDKCQSSLTADTYLSQNLEQIETSATEAIKVLRDSLFHLRPIRLSPVTIHEAVETALAETHIPEEIYVETSDLDLLPQVHACPKRLPLVFSNLLDNAVCAMGEKGEIKISGEAIGDMVHIHFADTGPGIQTENHERIFEFSYSTHGSGTNGNLGFGLWWVKTLLTRFGGSISVESAQNAGTTFIMEIPRAEVET